MAIKDYRLSVEADHDLEEIFDYTHHHYGLDQAMTYLESIDELFQKLIAHPHLGKSRDDIRPGLRSFPQGEHVVFYRKMTDHIRIVRVLHGRMDVPRFFEDK